MPDHLIAAGRLRVTHRQASLEELGKLADPPMTKDAVRTDPLTALDGGQKARVEGIPDTESAVTTDFARRRVGTAARRGRVSDRPAPDERAPSGLRPYRCSIAHNRGARGDSRAPTR